jgi:hypothetical protein
MQVKALVAHSAPAQMPTMMITLKIFEKSKKSGQPSV